MYNNKSYNTRNSGRYNTAGQFVPAAEQQHQHQQKQQQPQQQQQQQYPQQRQQPQQQQQQQQRQPQQQQQQQQPQQQRPVAQQQPPPPPAQQPAQSLPPQQSDMEMKPTEAELEAAERDARPPWMRQRLSGVKKITNRERRRRQNESLRRLLTPKNALMVLNEMLPKDSLASHQFTVEAAQNQYFSRNNYSFCADLKLEGTNYKGYGENKLSARNNAAEQAIRDLIIKKLNKATAAAADGAASEAGTEKAEEDEEVLPMIQLASFALHKLFAEWEDEGHRVPQLRPSANSVSEAGEPAMEEEPAPKPPKPAKVKGPRVVPENASAMHPCTLLGYMRAGLQYRELAAEGDRPQNMIYTMGVDVDGATYIGKAGNKKEARKQAARAACSALFGITFDN